MGSTLTGSAPKATFSTQPTIMPSQNDLLNMLVGIFQTGDPVKGVQQYPGTYSAPLNSLQNTSLEGLEQAAVAQAVPQPPVSKTASQTGAIDQGFNALTSALNFAAPKIDSTEAFQRGVVDPLTTNFNTQVLPGLDARFGKSAGGAYGSGRQQGSLTAANDLTTTLGQQGSTFAYNAATANQAAELSANQQRLAALGMTPALTALPTALDTSINTANDQSALNAEQRLNSQVQRLLATLGGGAVPYQQAQTQIAGQYGEFTRQQDEEQRIIQDMIAAALGTTVSTNGVGSGGSSGLLGGLLGGAGSLFSSSAGGTSAISGLLALLGGSDERIKEDLDQIGDVDGIPLYRFRYIGDSVPRLGFIAQDVERRLPSAVGRIPGTDIRTVNYSAVIESVLAEAV